jgi:fumarate reductase subunit C
MMEWTGQAPRGYRTRVSTYWWLGRWRYLKFILREVSSVFVAWTVFVILRQVSTLIRGPEAYAHWNAWLRHPLVIVLNVVSFFFLIFHAVTWFNLAPKAMAIRFGGRRLPGVFIAAPNYAAWLVISAVVAWIVLRR